MSDIQSAQNFCTGVSGEADSLDPSSTFKKSPPLRRSPQGRGVWGGRLWGAYIFFIYAYLYLCMFLGGPFFAFDHENYINFLNEPFPFFFEPGYTMVAYIVNYFFDEPLRFPLVFVVFTLPPFFLVWRCAVNSPSYSRCMMVYACVLTKSFYIGYIAQRFFFAELWVAALIIASVPRLPTYRMLLIPSLLHFSTLAVLPCLAWLKTAFSWKKVLFLFGLIVVIYIYIKMFSGFRLLGYDYTRYLDSDEVVGGVSFLSFMQMMVLIFIISSILPRSEVINFITLTCAIFSIKIIFSDIEVFSRIFQIQTDAVLIFAGLRAKRSITAIYLFCFGFLAIQIFYAKTSPEMAIHHLTAIVNVWRLF